MKVALNLGLGLFVGCWIIHLFIWRIHRPQAYPIWLPAIFLLLPLVGSVVVGALSHHDFLTYALDWEWVSGVILHIVLSCSYICGYAGIVEYSPSAEILFAVQKHMPEGISEESLTVGTLNEYSLTGKRIEHLLSSGVAKIESDRYVLTRLGASIARLSQNYRALLGISSMGEG